MSYLSGRKLIPAHAASSVHPYAGIKPNRPASTHIDVEERRVREAPYPREESTTLDEEAVEVGAVDIGALDDELYTGSQINTGISRSVRAWYASYGGYASMIVGQSSAFFSGNT